MPERRLWQSCASAWVRAAFGVVTLFPRVASLVKGSSTRSRRRRIEDGDSIGHHQTP